MVAPVKQSTSLIGELSPNLTGVGYMRFWRACKGCANGHQAPEAPQPKPSCSSHVPAALGVQSHYEVIQLYMLFSVVGSVSTAPVRKQP